MAADHLDTLIERNLYVDLRNTAERKNYTVEMPAPEGRRVIHLHGEVFHYVLDVQAASVSITRTEPTTLRKEYEPSVDGVVEAAIDLIRAVLRH